MGSWRNAKTTKMAAEVDMLAKSLADLNVVARSEFKLKPDSKNWKTEKVTVRLDWTFVFPFALSQF